MRNILLPWAIILSSTILSKAFLYSKAGEIGSKLTNWPTHLGKYGTARDQIIGNWDIGLNALIIISTLMVIIGSLMVIISSFKGEKKSNV